MADETIRIVVEGQDRATRTLTNVAHAMDAIQGSIRLAQQAYQLYDSTLGKALRTTQAYANQIRDLSAISGQSAEQTSRFVQVLDDYEIGAEDAMTATRALTKQGLAPNLETLAKLSDQYLAANTAQEKNELILKNLGRAGLQWVNVLKQGSAAILAQGAAVQKGLILSDKQLRQAEELRLAQDSLNDSTQALAVTFGTQLIPVLNSALPALLRLTGAYDQHTFLLVSTTRAVADAEEGSLRYKVAIATLNNALEKGIITEEEYLTALGKVRTKTIEVKDATDLLTFSNEELYKSLDPIQSAWDEYKDKGVTALGEVRRAIQQTTLSMLEQKFMLTDGLEPAERAVLEGLRKAWGLLDEATQDITGSIASLVEQFLAGAISAGELQRAIDALHGKTIHLNVVTNYDVSGEDAGQSPYNPPAPGGGGSGGGGGGPVPYASGGRLGRHWTLVGDAPGGRLTPYSELISPSGQVFPAAQTRGMLASGVVPRSAAGGMMGGGLGPTDDWAHNLSRMLARAVRDAMQQANI